MLLLVGSSSWLHRKTNVIKAFGIDCSLTPRSLGGQSRTTGKNVGPWASRASGHTGLPLQACPSVLWPSVPALSSSAAAFSPQEGDPPTQPQAGKKGTSLAGPPSFLPTQAHLPAHTKDSFSNRLPRFELFNKAFCFDLVFFFLFFFFFPLSSTAKIPDPAVAKIKDFLLVFSLSSVSVDWEGPRDGLLFPCQMRRGYLSSGGAYTGIRHYSALC